MSGFNPKETIAFLWNDFFLPIDDEEKVHLALNAVHAVAGYQPYNPFPGGQGTPVNAKSLVRMFVAPAEGGWTRILGYAQLEVILRLTDKLQSTMLQMWISESDADLVPHGTNDLSKFLREGKAYEDLQTALKALKEPLPQQPANPQQLDGQLADFAEQQGIDPKQANKLIEKTVGNLFKKVGGDVQKDAMSLVSQQNKSGQNPEMMRRMQVVMDCLTIPNGYWKKPNFIDLAAAYQIACQLDLNENARLLPGDEDILDKVEYPLDYLLGYYAK